MMIIVVEDAFCEQQQVTLIFKLNVTLIGYQLRNDMETQASG